MGVCPMAMQTNVPDIHGLLFIILLCSVKEERHPKEEMCHRSLKLVIVKLWDMLSYLLFQVCVLDFP